MTEPALSRPQQVLPDHSQKITDCGCPTTSAVYNPVSNMGKPSHPPRDFVHADRKPIAGVKTHTSLTQKVQSALP